MSEEIMQTCALSYGAIVNISRTLFQIQSVHLLCIEALNRFNVVVPSARNTR